jgi:hypothetical protein
LYPRMKQVLKWGRFANVAEIQRESLAALDRFLLKILDNVSRSGNIEGIAVSSHTGSTLKGTKVSNLYEYFK